MNKRDYELAKQVGLTPVFPGENQMIQNLIDLIRADEREACAKLADAASVYNRFISIEIASEIRARGKT